MTDEKLTADISELMDNHDIESAVVIFPRNSGELSVIGVNTSLEALKIIGHVLANDPEDHRGKLN